MDTNPALERAKLATKQGDKVRARAILREVLEQEPKNETAWLLLSEVTEKPEQAVQCLERVLKLNPTNQVARAKLEKIGSPDFNGKVGQKRRVHRESQKIEFETSSIENRKVTRPQLRHVHKNEHQPVQSPPSKLRPCPYCAEEIQEAAVVCRYCGRDLATGKIPQPAVVAQTAPQRLWSPGVAALLSFFIPGAGQIYKGKVGAGILWLVTVVIGYFLLAVPGLVLHIICIFNAATGDPYAQSKVTHARRVTASNQNAQRWTLLPIIAVLTGVLLILVSLAVLVGLISRASNSPAVSPASIPIPTAAVSPTSTPIPTAGIREFDYGETILLCGNYRVERGDKWESVATVCDITTWEQVSVKPDPTYPGKALITWKVGNKHLLFAWSGDALILWEAWESP